MAALENVQSTENDEDEFDEFNDPSLEWVASSIGGGSQTSESANEKVLFGSTALKDRRERIASGSDNRLIMHCFGRIASLPCKGKGGNPSYGTGTVFSYNYEWDLCYVLTCAHNIVDAYERKLYKRKKIQFQRIETSQRAPDDDKSSKLRLSMSRSKKSKNSNSGNTFKVAQTYDVLKAMYHPNFAYADQSPNDLAILIFSDKDAYYAKLFGYYGSINSGIRLVSSGDISDDFILTYELYGYPFSNDPNSTIVNGELYGMSGKSYEVVTFEKNNNNNKNSKKNDKRNKETSGSYEFKAGDADFSMISSRSSSQIHIRSPSGTVTYNNNNRSGFVFPGEYEMYVKLGEDKEMYYYNAIDTEPGQSGSCLFTELQNRVYGIVGVHTGGKEKLVKNWAVALNDTKIAWINDALKEIADFVYDNNKISWKFDYGYDYKNVNPASTVQGDGGDAGDGEEKEIDNKEAEVPVQSTFHLTHGITSDSKTIICNHNNLGCYCFFCVCNNSMKPHTGLYTLKLQINKVDNTFDNIVGITSVNYSTAIKNQDYDHQWLNDTEYIGWSAVGKDTKKYLPNGLYCGFSDSSRLNNVFRQKKWTYKSRNNEHQKRLPGWGKGDVIVLRYNSDLNILSFSKETDDGKLDAFIKDLPEMKTFYWFIGHANGQMSMTVID